MPAPATPLRFLTAFQLKCKQKQAHSLIRIQACARRSMQPAASTTTMCSDSHDCTRTSKGKGLSPHSCPVHPGAILKHKSQNQTGAAVCFSRSQTICAKAASHLGGEL